jgi:hypothetical protein
LNEEGIGSWECGNLARDLREISKARWKPVCGFHGAVISTAE